MEPFNFEFSSGMDKLFLINPNHSGISISITLGGKLAVVSILPLNSKTYVRCVEHAYFDHTLETARCMRAIHNIA